MGLIGVFFDGGEGMVLALDGGLVTLGHRISWIETLFKRWSSS